MSTDTSSGKNRIALHRRRLLALSGVGIATVAGCSDPDEDDDTADDEDDDTTDDENDDTDDGDDEDDEESGPGEGAGY